MSLSNSAENAPKRPKTIPFFKMLRGITRDAAWEELPAEAKCMLVELMDEAAMQLNEGRWTAAQVARLTAAPQRAEAFASLLEWGWIKRAPAGSMVLGLYLESGNSPTSKIKAVSAVRSTAGRAGGLSKAANAKKPPAAAEPEDDQQSQQSPF